MLRVTLLTALVAAVLAPSALAQATASAPPPLTAEQVAAIGPVLLDAKVLDASKPQPAQLSRYTSACRALGTADPLIRGFRALCRTDGDAYLAGLRVPTCKSSGRCRARLTRYATDLTRQLGASRAFNRTLAAGVADHDCRMALRVGSPQLATMTRLRNAARALAHAVRAGTAKQVNAGVARFYAIDRSPLLDHKGRSDAFAAACE